MCHIFIAYITVQEAEGKVTECARQIALADMVILNKQDLIDQPARDVITQQIKSMNSTCGIQYTTFCRVDLDAILGIQAYTTANPPTLVVTPYSVATCKDLRLLE